MTFWDIFSDRSAAKQYTNSIHQKIQSLLPDRSEEELINIACISGLMARVAHVDLDITQEEISTAKFLLEKWCHLNSQEIEAVVHLAFTEIQALSGLENYKYAGPLADSLSIDDRFNLLQSLFAIAASDGNADNAEVEELRTICKALRLEHGHYIAAKASVIKQLGSLKKN